MSGIAGLLHLDGSMPPAEHLARMTDSMRARGPDGIHHWLQGPIALGHCRLCSTAESLQETQPLANDDETLVLVADVRLDNWRELRASLKGLGCSLRDASDAELLLRAYEYWGEACLAQLAGDFAFAVWHRREQRLFCARDRMGNKGLYWYLDEQRFVFATDLAAIVELPGAWQVNEQTLVELVSSNWHIGCDTLWDGVQSLAPAHAAVLDDGRFRMKRYWSPRLDALLHCRDEREYAEAYRECFLRSVARHSRSHVPLAVEVSGGLDSSAVFAAALQLQRNAALPAPDLTGWSMACSEDARADESAWVRELAAFTGESIHEVPAFLPDLAWFEARSRQCRDMPPYPHTTGMESVLERAAASGSRAILTGLGGDEWLWGSRLYYCEGLQNRDWRGLAQSWRADVQDYGYRQSLRWFLRHGVVAALPDSVRHGLLRAVRVLRGAARDPDRRPWVPPPLRARARPFGPAHVGRLPRAGQVGIVEQLQDPMVLWSRQTGDRAYALHGLEPRSPMYTAEFVQFACSLPESMLMRGNSHKYIHVQALQGMLPASLLERRSKGEYSWLFQRQLAALDGWFLAALQARHPDWVVAEALPGLLQQGLQRQHSAWPQWQLWNLYACDRFLELNSGRVGS